MATPTEATAGVASLRRAERLKGQALLKYLSPDPEKGTGVEPVQSGLLKEAVRPPKRRHAVPVASEALSLIVCDVSTGLRTGKGKVKGMKSGKLVRLWMNRLWRTTLSEKETGNEKQKPVLGSPLDSAFSDNRHRFRPGYLARELS